MLSLKLIHASKKVSKSASEYPRKQCINFANVWFRYRSVDGHGDATLTSWWRHYMSWERASHYWPFVRGIHDGKPPGSLHIVPIMLCGYDVFFDVILNNRLNKLSSCQWFEAPWRLCDVTVMCVTNTVLNVWRQSWHHNDSRFRTHETESLWCQLCRHLWHHIGCKVPSETTKWHHDDFRSLSYKFCRRYARHANYTHHLTQSHHIPGPRTGCSRAVPGLFWTKIVRPLTGPARSPCGAVRILPPRAGPVEF